MTSTLLIRCERKLARLGRIRVTDVRREPRRVPASIVTPGDALVSSEHTLRGLLELTELLTDARRLGCGRDARHDEQL
jgi:hypothetical protein